MLSFEDLFRLKPNILQSVISIFSDDCLINALSVYNSDLQTALLINLEKERREYIQTELANHALLSYDQVKKARLEIENVLNKYDSAGEFLNSFITSNDENFKPKEFEYDMEWAKTNEKELIIFFIAINQFVRENGILALEDYIEKIEEPLLKYGLRCIVKGYDNDLVMHVLENRAYALNMQNNIKTKLIISGVIHCTQVSPRLLKDILDAFVI